MGYQVVKNLRLWMSFFCLQYHSLFIQPQFLYDSLDLNGLLAYRLVQIFRTQVIQRHIVSFENRQEMGVVERFFKGIVKFGYNRPGHALGSDEEDGGGVDHVKAHLFQRRHLGVARQPLRAVGYQEP